MYSEVYKDRRVLITGHTGFKGSWLALWLQKLGAKVTGVSLTPDTTPNHWNLLNLDIKSYTIDVRNVDDLHRAVLESDPEFVFHLAAQPLVRLSYKNPLETWTTNVIGTANLLNECRSLRALRGVIVVTSDKCYLNREWPFSYRETDQLGGHDPYSASKASTELVVESFRRSFFSTPTGARLATARAGNVIGGGDWSEDRLIPDVIRSINHGTELTIRYPKATRPWQHVLESLSGYLLLGQKLLEQTPFIDEAWNFGPGPDGNKTVGDVLEAVKQQWPRVSWSLDEGNHSHEAQLLQLDCSKARKLLGWDSVWSFSETIEKTTTWYQSFIDQNAMLTHTQLDEYIRCASERGRIWTRSS